MQRNVLENKYMACPFQIQMCDNQGQIGLGTAFFYEVEDETFIITNWHNVTGKHHVSGAPVLENGRTPMYINAKWPAVDDMRTVEGSTSLYLKAQRVEIEVDGEPLWFEHPELGSLCDVVAIPTRRPTAWPSIFHSAANRIDETPIPVEPGLKVIVIGFPRGLSTGPGLPLMKTGFLSSMPGFDVHLDAEFSEMGRMRGGFTVPAAFLDVHTVPGMSGSPVFIEYTGNWNPDALDSNELTDNFFIGSTSRLFLGCHSSRLLESEERSGLGICYRADAIDDICRSQCRGRRFPKTPDETGFTYTRAKFSDLNT